MYFTYVVRPGEAPIGRSPNFRPFWDACMNWNLRLGLGLMLLSFMIIEISAFIGGTRGWGLVNLSTSGERMNCGLSEHASYKGFEIRETMSAGRPSFQFDIHILYVQH
eukprot:Gregarina_sp_Poly_1__980@NODE_1239_length_4674_cov_201_846538_g844_i0_p4_GENE_NODE_1239_length_4674_cov_201_846538_g844_i0NODE_1239_length_4674_cov_201_846538_g844_i0_p4_ORF_typecomplete_len108_score1_93DUF3273/PF11677_8/0_061CrgA/PF06781_12/0_091_NODE_1239_length_4674_cov_201_846538_g844_i037614084